MMYRKSTAFTACLCLVLVTMVSLSEATAIRQPVTRSRRAIVEVENPEETIRILGSLAENILQAAEIEEKLRSEKRGIDLGLSRGFSGSQAAKHLMGLAAASFANGPGRRRREATGEN